VPGTAAFFGVPTLHDPPIYEDPEATTASMLAARLFRY